MIKKIKHLFSNNTYFKSFCVCLGILIFVVLFFDLKFETNDDIAMKRYVSGAYGVFDYHIIFSNVLIGKLLATLYRINLHVSWYEVLQYILIFISLYCITIVFITHNKNIYLFFFFLLVLSIDLYTRLQFTKTSAVVSFAGGLLIIDNINTKKNISLCFGAFLVLLGFLYRAQEAIAIIGLIAISYIPFFKTENIQKCAVVCCALIVLFSITELVNKNEYNSKDWKYYSIWNINRAELTDNGFPSFDDVGDSLLELGFYRNDFSLYSNWDFNDPDKLNLDNLLSIISLKKGNDINIFVKIKKIIKNFFFKEGLGFTIIFILSIFLITIYNISDSRLIISCALMSFLLIGEIVYCCVIQGGLKTRVIFPLYSAVILLSIYYSLKNSDAVFLHINKILYFIFVFVFIICINYKQVNLLSKGRRSEEEFRYFDDNTIYVFDILPCNRFNNYSLFSINDFGEWTNKIFLGGWETNSPVIKQIERSNGFHNPYIDIVNNSNALLVSTYDSVETIVKYINENYYDIFNGKPIYYEVEKKLVDDIYLFIIKTD